MEVFKPAERKGSEPPGHAGRERAPPPPPPVGWETHSHALLHNVRVNLSHAVDGVRSQHAQMGHVDPLGLALLDEGHPPQAVRVAGEPRRNRLTHGAQVQQKTRLYADVCEDSSGEVGPKNDLRPGVSG